MDVTGSYEAESSYELRSADASFADVEEQKVFSTNRGRTYFGPPGMEHGEHNWMLNFTMKIKDRVMGLEGKSASGLICVLKQKDYPDEPQQVFLRNTSWSNRKMLVADLQSGCTTAPTFVVYLSSNDLQKYGDWLIQKFISECQRTGRPTKKQVVKHIGLQQDGITWYFNADLVIQTDPEDMEGGRVVDGNTCSYIAVKNQPSPCRVRISEENKSRGLMRKLYQVLPEDCLHAFVLMCAHCYLSFHYSDLSVLAHLHIPALVPYGPTGTGKTTMSRTGLCYFGEGMDDVCSMEKATEAGLAKRWTEFHLPIVINDCDNADLAAATVESCFERSLSINFREIQGVRPASSILLTMNNEMVTRMLRAAKTKMKTASRAIFMFMETAYPHLDAATVSKIQKYKSRSSKFLPRLLNWNPAHSASFAQIVEDAHETVRPVVEAAGISESSVRITESYALLWAATVTFLDAVRDTVVDRFALRTFFDRVIHHGAKFQIPDSSTREVRLSTSGADISQSKAAFVNAVRIFRERATSTEVSALLREHVLTNNCDHFAVKLQYFAKFLEDRHLLTSAQEFEGLKMIEGSNERSYVRMCDGKRAWCLTIPRSAFTDAEVELLDGVNIRYPDLDIMHRGPEETPQDFPVPAKQLDSFPSTNLFVKSKERAGMKGPKAPCSEPGADEAPVVHVRIKSKANPHGTVGSLKRKVVSADEITDKSSSAILCAVPTCVQSLLESQQNVAWIRCTECELAFHLQCANVSPIALGTRRGALSRAWKCKYCSAKSRGQKKTK